MPALPVHVAGATGNHAAPKDTMTRFIAGIAVAIVVHLIGWPRIESALKAANDGASRAYTAAESELRASKVGK